MVSQRKSVLKCKLESLKEENLQLIHIIHQEKIDIHKADKLTAVCNDVDEYKVTGNDVDKKRKKTKAKMEEHQESNVMNENLKKDLQQLKNQHFKFSHESSVRESSSVLEGSTSCTSDDWKMDHSHVLETPAVILDHMKEDCRNFKETAMELKSVLKKEKRVIADELVEKESKTSFEMGKSPISSYSVREIQKQFEQRNVVGNNVKKNQSIITDFVPKINKKTPTDMKFLLTGSCKNIPKRNRCARCKRRFQEKVLARIDEMSKRCKKYKKESLRMKLLIDQHNVSQMLDGIDCLLKQFQSFLCTELK